MKLIVCLGNPGKEYENTRHNIGFLIAGYARGIWAQRQDMFAIGREKNALYETFEFDWHDEELGEKDKVIVLLPQTFMNLSGKAVFQFLRFVNDFTISEDLIVVHDDIDIPFGNLKIAKNASAAGHNGVKDIIQQLGTKDFIRLRVGIRPESGRPEKTDEFVLRNFTATEKKVFADLFPEAEAALMILLRQGLERAQSKHNSGRGNC